MSDCPLAFRMPMIFHVLNHLLASNRRNFMKFLYGHGVMMHVKIYKDVIGCREVIAFDCLNINNFAAIHMNTHSDAHEYSLEQEFLPKGVRALRGYFGTH